MAANLNQGGTVPSFSDKAIQMAARAMFDADRRETKLIITVDGKPYNPLKDATPDTSIVQVETDDLLFVVKGNDFRRIQRVVYELEKERDKKGVWMS